MAFGWSGSNGGISNHIKKIYFKEVMNMALGLSGSNGGIDLDRCEKHRVPLEISYFVNNVCNLKCRHCYVGYKEEQGALSVGEWKNVFDQLINLGAKTFGNVGKEPLLSKSWENTLELLRYFQKKREKIPDLRFGFVTNGIFLDEPKILELEKIVPDYIDISLDGDQEVHNQIRGAGAYEKLMENLQVMSKYDVINKVFISFTANRINLRAFPDIVKTVYTLGIKKILVSPYVDIKDRQLHISNSEMSDWVELLLQDKIVEFKKYSGLNIYVKSDYTTTGELAKEFLSRGIIDKDNLHKDSYGVIFTKYYFRDDNVVYFNYLPFDNSFYQAIRISHDGYISDCYSMFFEDYPKRAIGNIRKKSISEILAPYRSLAAV